MREGLSSQPALTLQDSEVDTRFLILIQNDWSPL